MIVWTNQTQPLRTLRALRRRCCCNAVDLEVPRRLDNGLEVKSCSGSGIGAEYVGGREIQCWEDVSGCFPKTAATASGRVHPGQGNTLNIVRKSQTQQWIAENAGRSSNGMFLSACSLAGCRGCFGILSFAAWRSMFRHRRMQRRFRHSLIRCMKEHVSASGWVG